MDINEYNEPTTYQPLSATVVPNSNWFNDVNFNRQLLYAPENPVLNRIVSTVSSQIGFTTPVVGFPNSLELLNVAQVTQPFASIEFDEDLRVKKDSRNFSLKLKNEFDLRSSR